MDPETAHGVESVEREEVESVVCNELHGAHDEVEHRFADEVVEVDAHPARLDALAPTEDLTLELV